MHDARGEGGGRWCTYPFRKEMDSVIIVIGGFFFEGRFQWTCPLWWIDHSVGRPSAAFISSRCLIFPHQHVQRPFS